MRQMLGLADRTRVIDLFESLMRGDIAAALTELRSQYDTGADPAVVLADLAEFTHFVTRVKIVPAVADDASLIEVERVRGRAFAEKLSMRVLARTWQMLLKGLAEVQAAGRPVAAAEMVLVRIAYAADLPTPDEVVRSLSDGTSLPASRGSRAERHGRGQHAGAVRLARCGSEGACCSGRGTSPTRRARRPRGRPLRSPPATPAQPRQPRPLSLAASRS